MALATAVLQAERKARCVAKLGNGRRAQREDKRIAHPHQRSKSAACQSLCRVLRTHAFGPILERDKSQCSVLPLAGEAKAQDTDHALHFGLFQQKPFDLLHHTQRALLCRARRQLHVDQNRSLILVGQE